LQSYSKEIKFDGIINCRDLGGYKAEGNRTVAWRRLFRSGYIHPMTEGDLRRLKEELKLTSVIDLRRNNAGQNKEVSLLNSAGIKYFNTPFLSYQKEELKLTSVIDLRRNNAGQNKEVSLLNSAGIKYFNTPFLSYQKEELNYDFTNMGEAFLFRIRHKEYAKPLIDALEIIADPKNHPLLFHCGAGKDRSGLLAAFVLSVLGVADKDIVSDYALSAQYMPDMVKRLMQDPETPDDVKNLPAYTWEATAASMALFLSVLKQEFGSARRYLEMNGADKSLFERLEKALLI
jgi:protein-tyrosine phosphatase